MIYYDKPASEYHAGPGISKSGLDKITISPAHYKASLDRPQKPTEELYIGSATHTLTLEPEKFEREFIVAPPIMDRRTKEGKAIAEQLEASGKQILTYQQYELIQGMALSVRSNETALELISGGHTEVSFDAIWDGVLVRGRCDYLRSDGVVVDLKTTKSAHPNQFVKSIADFRYHVQAAIYTDLLMENGIYVPEFVFIAVEKTYPFAVGIYTVDEAGVEKGRKAYKRDLATYKACSELGVWPGYPEEVVQLTLPSWA
jgi:exodeoxyribonuclease VIII